MAQHLGRVFGTEEDKVNCSYYFKMGACRHGDACGRKHIRPQMSQTLLLPHLYENPMVTLFTASGGNVRLSAEQSDQLARAFEATYVDLFDEVSKFGEVHELQVCDNLGDHMVRGRARARAHTHTRAHPPPARARCSAH